MWHTSMHACIHTYMHACSHTMNVCLQSCRLWYSQIMACLYVCDNGMGKHVYLCHIHMWIISSHVICAFCFRICACARVLCVWVLHTHNTHTHTHTHTQLSQHLTLRYGFKMLLHAAWCPSTTQRRRDCRRHRDIRLCTFSTRVCAAILLILEGHVVSTNACVKEQAQTLRPGLFAAQNKRFYVAASEVISWSDWRGTGWRGGPASSPFEDSSAIAAVYLICT